MAKGFSEKIFLLNRAVVASIQSQNQEGIVKELMQTAVKVFNADFGYCFIKDSRNKFKLIYKTKSTPYEPMTPRAGGIVARTFSSKSPKYIEDVSKLGFVRYDAKQNMVGAAVIPISHKKSRYGVMIICYKKSHKFTDEEKLMGDFLGNSAAQAIATNRLYNDLLNFQRTLDNTHDSIFIFDPNTLRITYVNKGATKLVGATKTALLRQTMGDVNLSMRAEDLQKRIREIRHASTKDYATLEAEILHPVKGKRHVEITLQDMKEVGDQKNFLAIIRNITQRKLAENSMAKMAYYDQLTGIANRSLLTERLEKEHLRAEKQKGMYSVFFIDLDRFKIINDIYGHHSGDMLLKQVAARIKKAVPKRATVARMGGDEFIVMLPKVKTNKEAENCALAVQGIFGEFFQISEQEIYSNGSIGYATYPIDGTDYRVVMKHADLALHRAKEHGGGNIQHYRSGQPTFYTMQPKLQSQLRKAFKQNELMLEYQPIVNVKQKRITSCEALVRWNHPEMGLIYPGDFVGQAEESGLIIEMGEWVINEVCRQIQKWEDEGRIPPPVSINLSPRELLRPTLVAHIDETLRKYRISPSQIKLELTETFLMKNIDLSINILEQLKSLGLRILIDDFGTGYASLSYLKRLPIDAVKIDRTFIAGVPTSLQDAALTSAIIAISHQLGLEVIAEGVENQDQFDFLRAAQCNFAQGNFFFKPVSGDQLGDLLRLSHPY